MAALNSCGLMLLSAQLLRMGLAAVLLASVAGAWGQLDQSVTTQNPRPYQNDDVDYLWSLANRADTAAQYQLGTKYLHGRGVPKDVERGLRWLRHAASERNK